MPPPLLSLDHATFRLGDRLVFENTSWEFQRDEHWAVLGENGSGKSLFADALRGALPLVGGALNCHFKPPAGFMPEECIGHVSFQERKATAGEMVVQSRWNSFDLAEAATVRDYLSYDEVMRVNPFEETDRHLAARAAFLRRQRRALDLFDARQFLTRSLVSLSNGERQRVEIARALSLPLKLLILDEPFIGLDARRRQQLTEALRHLMRGSLRMLFITARPSELPSGVSRVLWIENCRVLSAGARNTVLKQFGELVSRRRTQRIAKRTPKAPLRSRKSGAELVKMRGVTVRYNGATLLQGIDWVVREGESWALLGPNGSGKTTLLSLIQGDNPQAYSNDITVLGMHRGSGESIWRLKRRIGWVSPELHAHFDDAVSCLAVVESGFTDTIGVYDAVSRAERQEAKKWLNRFGLSDFASAPLFSLSSGLQRMVLLARALVKKPRLLILDEPCQGLDERHRDLFISAVDALLRSGRETAIYVTHRREEIPPSIGKILRLENGRAVNAGAR